MNRITRHLKQNIVPKLKVLGGFSALSKETGVSESAIRKLATGDNVNPTIKVVDALDRALCQESEFLSQGRVQTSLLEMKDADSPEKAA